jgi:hypothetical protein
VQFTYDHYNNIKKTCVSFTRWNLINKSNHYVNFLKVIIWMLILCNKSHQVSTFNKSTIMSWQKKKSYLNTLTFQKLNIFYWWKSWNNNSNIFWLFQHINQIIAFFWQIKIFQHISHVIVYTWNVYSPTISEILFYFPLKIPYAKMEAQPIE